MNKENKTVKKMGKKNRFDRFDTFMEKYEEPVLYGLVILFFLLPLSGAITIFYVLIDGLTGIISIPISIVLFVLLLFIAFLFLANSPTATQIKIVLLILVNIIGFYSICVLEIPMTSYEKLNKDFIQDEKIDGKITGYEAYLILNKEKKQQQKEF